MKALDGGGWSLPRSGRFTPGKETWHPLHRRVGGPHGQSGQVRKTLPPSGFDPQTVQPVAVLTALSTVHMMGCYL